MAGASGFLGTAWRDHLAREGHEVVRLVRGEAMSAYESHWDPYAGQVDAAVIESADVSRTSRGRRSLTGRGPSPTSGPSSTAESRPPGRSRRRSPPPTGSPRSWPRTGWQGT